MKFRNLCVTKYIYTLLIYIPVYTFKLFGQYYKNTIINFIYRDLFVQILCSKLSYLDLHLKDVFIILFSLTKGIFDFQIFPVRKPQSTLSVVVLLFCWPPINARRFYWGVEKYSTCVVHVNSATLS